jgi:hypothetical protein
MWIGFCSVAKLSALQLARLLMTMWMGATRPITTRSVVSFSCRETYGSRVIDSDDTFYLSAFNIY